MTLRAWKDRVIFWTALLFAGVAVAADSLSATRALRLGAGDALRVAATSAAWAVLTSSAAVAGLILAGALASLAARDPARRKRTLVAGASLPVALAVVLLGLDLLSGRGISGKPWVGIARVAWVVMAPVAVLLAGQIALRAPRLAAAAGALVVPLALVLDRRVYPSLYPAGHAMLWLAIFAGVLAVAALLASRPRPATTTLGGSAALLIGWSVIALLFVDPLADAPVARAAAYRETLFLKRALTHLKPASPLRPPEADPGIVEALRSARELDGSLLDRTFPGRRRMNVLVVSIDAVRADRLASPRKVTPNLDALAARGTWFQNAWTTYPFTLVAFASAFTGVYAAATDHFRYRELDLFRSPWPLQPTLATVLGAAGWRTEAVVGFPRWVKETLAREGGFQHFNAEADPRAAEREMVAEEVASLAISALDRDPGKPFFLWVHFFDPHWPYEPPGPRPFGDSHAGRYDAELQYADRELGRLLDAMGARDLLGNTAIVVFSDHGEDLVEHDHGTALNEIQIHVPILFVLPRVPPRRVSLAVDLTDLAPTVLDLVGVGRPDHFQGQSLLACALLDPASGGPFPPDLAFCELGGARLPQPRQFAAREGKLKVICHADSETYELFDLAADPDERRDLSQETPDALGRMKRVLDSLRAVATTRPQEVSSRPAPK
jgi:arylsulfatase A-like enzyme